MSVTYFNKKTLYRYTFFSTHFLREPFRLKWFLKHSRSFQIKKTELIISRTLSGVGLRLFGEPAWW